MGPASRAPVSSPATTARLLSPRCSPAGGPRRALAGSFVSPLCSTGAPTTSPPRWARPSPQAGPRSAAPWASASRRSAAPPPVSRRSIRAAAPTAAAALASPCARRPLPRTVSSQPSPSRTPWSASPPWGGVASHAARARPDTPSPAMVTPGSPPLARRCNPPASLRTTAMVRRAAPALPRTRRHSNPCVRWRPPPAPPSPRAPPGWPT